MSGGKACAVGYSTPAVPLVPSIQRRLPPPRCRRLHDAPALLPLGAARSLGRLALPLSRRPYFLEK